MLQNESVNPLKDAGPIRPSSAGAVSPPFTSRDLYGTGEDRLQSISSTLGNLAERFRAWGDSRVADECEASSKHYAELAKIHRGDA